MRRWLLPGVCLLLLGCDSRAVFVPITWAELPAGSFYMGTPASELCREPGEFKETRHRVTLARGIAVSVTETTQGPFQDLLGYNPTSFVRCGPDCPVEGVNWHEAAAFCNALSAEDGLDPCYACQGTCPEVSCETRTPYAGQGIYLCPGYRLPTEAEWEYACRAGSSTAYYNGPASECHGMDPLANQIGWYGANSGLTLHRAGQKKPNDWGLYDLPGSVWEWTHDWYEADLGSEPRSDPVSQAEGSLGRVLRGGSAEVPPGLLRSGSRYNYAEPAQRLRLHGFRCVRSLPRR